VVVFSNYYHRTQSAGPDTVDPLQSEFEVCSGFSALNPQFLFNLLQNLTYIIQGISIQVYPVYYIYIIRLNNICKVTISPHKVKLRLASTINSTTPSHPRSIISKVLC